MYFYDFLCSLSLNTSGIQIIFNMSKHRTFSLLDDPLIFVLFCLLALYIP